MLCTWPVTLLLLMCGFKPKLILLKVPAGSWDHVEEKVLSSKIKERQKSCPKKGDQDNAAKEPKEIRHFEIAKGQSRNLGKVQDILLDCFKISDENKGWAYTYQHEAVG